MSHRFTALIPALALAALAACDQGSTGPNAAGGSTSFTLSQASTSGASASVIALDDHGPGPQGPRDGSIPVSDIKSLVIRVTGLAALPVGNDSIEDRDWVHLTAVHPTLLNLLALPTHADSAVLLTRGTLPAGKYGHLRILFDSSAITFAQTVTVGRAPRAVTFKADSTYKLFVGGFGMPGDSQDSDNDGDQLNHFGIVVPAQSFTVAKDTASTVALFFNPGESVRNVRVTGHGLFVRVVMSAAKQHDDSDNDADDNK